MLKLFKIRINPIKTQIKPHKAHLTWSNPLGLIYLLFRRGVGHPVSASCKKKIKLLKCVWYKKYSRKTTFISNKALFISQINCLDETLLFLSTEKLNKRVATTINDDWLSWQPLIN